MTRAAIYCRISSDPSGLRVGVERQERECRALVERRGWTVADVYTDNDLSAWSGARRPDYQRLLADIAAGTVRAVVVWHLDRLTRSPKELEDFFETCDAAGLKRMGTVSGDIDLGTRDGQLNARILGAVAKKSSDDTSARIRVAFDAKAARGEYKWGGERPFGYAWDAGRGQLVSHPEEAALVREAVDRILAGESRRRITQDWHARGIRTPKGKPWSITRLSQVLTSPRLAGKRVHRGEVIGDGNWEPLIDTATQERVVRRMGRQTVGRRPGRQRWLLTGLAYCGQCDNRLQAKARKSREGAGFRTYRCSTDAADTCGGCSVIAEPVEQIVLWTAWVHYRPDFRAGIEEAFATSATEDPRATDLRAVMLDLVEAEKQLTHDTYVERVVPRAAYLESVTELRERRETAERELARLAEAGDALPPLTREQAWKLTGPPPTLTAAEPEDVEFWRAIVRAVFDKVVIKANWRGRRFSPDRVTLIPRPEFPTANVPYHSWDLPTMDPSDVSRIALD